MTDVFAVVDSEEIPTERFQTCETRVRELTDPFGCEEIRCSSTQAR